MDFEARKGSLTAIIPKMRFAEAQSALPVPLSFVAKISGVYAYSTAYLKRLAEIKKTSDALT